MIHVLPKIIDVVGNVVHNNKILKFILFTLFWKVRELKEVIHKQFQAINCKSKKLESNANTKFTTCLQFNNCKSV